MSLDIVPCFTLESKAIKLSTLQLYMIKTHNYVLAENINSGCMSYCDWGERRCKNVAFVDTTEMSH